MNNIRRKRLQRIANTMSATKKILDRVLLDEQHAYNYLPRNLVKINTIVISAEAIITLSSISEDLDKLIHKLENVGK